MTGSPRTSRLLAALVAGALLALLPLVAVRAQEARDITPACSTATQSEFSDRPEGDFGKAVDCITWYGIAKGLADGTYGPGRVVTRGQMATFLANTLRVAGADMPQDPPDAFDDDNGHAHEDNINVVAELGIAKGVTADKFAPNNGVRRDQMATFVVGQIEVAIGEKLPDPTGNHFEDDDGNTHEESINKLADAGIVSGVAEGKYNPGGQVTRQQMALFLSRDLAFMTEEHDVALRRIGFGPAVTDGPDLLEVNEISKDSTQATLEFVFDEPVTGITADKFAIYSFDGKRVIATAAQAATGNTSAVRASFPRADYDVSPVAGVQHDAVQSPAPESIQNPEGSAPIQAVTLPGGTTAAPDLVSVTAEDGSATFEFDEAATQITDPGAPGDGGYHLVLGNGTVKDGTGTTSGDGTDTHEVTFALTAAEASQVVRGVVESETVEDADGNANAQQAAVVASGGRTDDPDLVAIRLLPSEDKVEFEFDEAVTLPAANPVTGSADGAFRIYYLDGTEADTDTRTKKAGAGAVVVAEFEDGEVSETVAGGSVDGASVTDGSADEVGLQLTFAPGDTAAPKLISAGVTEAAGPVNTTNRSVIYTFDQAVDFDSANENKFVVYAADGTRNDLSAGSCSVAENKVTCTANSGQAAALFEAIGSAVLATTADGAVTEGPNSQVESGSFMSHEGAAVL